MLPFSSGSGYRFHNTIWHVFVLAETFVLYAAVLLELSGRAPGA